MQLGILQKETHNQTQATKKPSVSISTNLTRQRVLLDSNGNQINNFKSKQIIKSAEQE